MLFLHFHSLFLSYYQQSNSSSLFNRLQDHNPLRLIYVFRVFTNITKKQGNQGIVGISKYSICNIKSINTTKKQGIAGIQVFPTIKLSVADTIISSITCQPQNHYIILRMF